MRARAMRDATPRAAAATQSSAADIRAARQPFAPRYAMLRQRYAARSFTRQMLHASLCLFSPARGAMSCSDLIDAMPLALFLMIRRLRASAARAARDSAMRRRRFDAPRRRRAAAAASRCAGGAARHAEAFAGAARCHDASV